MGYSRENKRQNDALQSILDGNTPEKRIFVAMEDVNEKKERKKEIKLESDRMWYLYGHCFNCQVKVENKLRIEGKFEEWSHKKIIANKLSWIQDQKEEIKSFRNQKAPEFLQQINPDGHSVDKEKWEVDITKVRKQADEALEYLQKMEDSLK
jgi:hypothetical protein